MEHGRSVVPPIINPERQVARPERFELPTFWFVARRSIQLSYERVLRGSNYDLIVSARFGSVKPSYGAIRSRQGEPDRLEVAVGAVSALSSRRAHRPPPELLCKAGCVLSCSLPAKRETGGRSLYRPRLQNPEPYRDRLRGVDGDGLTPRYVISRVDRGGVVLVRRAHVVAANIFGLHFSRRNVRRSSPESRTEPHPDRPA